MTIATSSIDQISAMRMGVDYSFTIELRKFSLRVRPLAISETVKVVSAVSEALSAVPQNMRTILAENLLIAKETIKLASTSDVGSSDVRITDYVMDRMTPEELQTLFKEYVANCDRVNPSLDLMTPAKLEELISTVKKNARTPEDVALQLTALSLSQLRSLATFFLTKDV